MKYFGERTNKLYDTAEACEKAEFEAKEKENREKILAERKAAELKAKKEQEAAERKAMATEVDKARKVMVAAQKAYREAIENFVKRYGTYHYSTDNFEDVPTLFDVFDWLPKLL